MSQRQVGADGGGKPVVVHVSPHPDDEVLGAGATLLALQDAGWRVINLACSFGRPEHRQRRQAELAGALDILGFEAAELDPPAALGAADDLSLAVEQVASGLKRLLEATGATLVVSPHQQDGHHAHVAVANGVAKAVEQLPGVVWWTWGFWVDLPQPTLYHSFDGSLLMRVIAAMEAHEGENLRNSYIDLIPTRARTNAILGSERVFGYGTSAASVLPYAEVLTELRLVGGERFPGAPRVLDWDHPLTA